MRGAGATYAARTRRGADSTIFPPIGMQTICIPPARGKPSTVRPTSKREVGGTQVSSTASRSNVCEILLVSSNQEHCTHMVPPVPRKMASTVILEPPDFNLTTLPVLISFAIVSRPSRIAEGHGNAVGRLNCHVRKAYSRGSFAPQKRASAQHHPFSNAMPQNWERLSRPTVPRIEIRARMD
jgi:hypothetical protein